MPDSDLCHGEHKAGRVLRVGGEVIRNQGQLEKTSLRGCGHREGSSWAAISGTAFGQREQAAGGQRVHGVEGARGPLESYLEKQL